MGIPRFLRYLERSGKSGNTLDLYSRVLNAYAQFLAFNDLEISSDSAKQFLEDYSRNHSPGSVRTAGYVLKSLFSFLGIPARFPVPRSKPSLGLPGISDKELIQRISKLKDLRLRLALELCFHAGLRVSELLGIRFQDLTPDGIRVIRKGGYQQSIPIPQKLLDRLGSLASSRSGRLFPWDRFKFYRLVKSALGINPHKIRHIRATQLAMITGDAPFLAEMMGWRSLDTAMRYIHLSGSQLRSKAARYGLL